MQQALEVFVLSDATEAFQNRQMNHTMKQWNIMNHTSGLTECFEIFEYHLQPSLLKIRFRGAARLFSLRLEAQISTRKTRKATEMPRWKNAWKLRISDAIWGTPNPVRGSQEIRQLDNSLEDLGNFSKKTGLVKLSKMNSYDVFF